MRLEDAFGATLKELRVERSISQDTLASCSDLDRTYISLLERGLRSPSLNTLFQIAEALDISPESIVREVKTKCNEGIS